MFATQWENAFLPVVVYMFRIVIACICGAVIGLERNKRKKEAGLRTHIIVALGAVLVMIVSKYGFMDMLAVDERISVDPSRVAANIVTGISFLGAGTIVWSGRSVKGLTTAAGIWATAAVGMTLGAGMYAVGAFSTAGIVFIQYMLHRFVRSGDSASISDLSVTLLDVPDAVEMFAAQLEHRGISIHSGGIHKHENGTILLTLSIDSDNGLSFEEILDLCNQNGNIRRIS